MCQRCSVLIVLLAAAAARAQLLDSLFPDATKADIRQRSDVLVTKNPGVDLRDNSVGNTNSFTSTADQLTQVPLALARNLKVSSPFIPMFNSASDRNIAGLSRNIHSDFNAGLSNQDARLSVDKLIVKYGYTVERHRVQTEDGYVLTLFRIPGNGPAVLLMHGLLGSADDWVVAGADSGVAYLLARDGYDVWMGNARGNKHSREHVKMDPMQAAFWDFSWHEIGYYDLPAMIDYVLDTTNSSQLKYVGHSQGTTSFFVMASERPDYNEKISVMIALSPVAFMENVKSPVVRLLAPESGLLHLILKNFGLYEFLPDDIFVDALKALICGFGPISEILCNNILFLIVGFDFSQLNVTNIPVVFGHFPSGCATKELAHYGQEVSSGKFCKFDYGVTENLERYGTDKPPDYQLDRITTPVALFFSDGDWLAHPKDVANLYNQLGNVVDVYKIPHKHFNHLDFVIAKDVTTLVYKRLWKILEYFSG